MAARPDLRQVLREGHAAVDHDRGAAPRGRCGLPGVSSISSTVVRSWRLPSKTSCALGKPSRSRTNPITTCLQSGRWSRE